MPTVRAYDPAAGPQAPRACPDLDVVDDPARAVIGADVVVIATEWPEFRDLPWAAWAHAGAPRLIIDGRRLLDAPRFEPPATGSSSSATAARAGRRTGRPPALARSDS